MVQIYAQLCLPFFLPTSLERRKENGFFHPWLTEEEAKTALDTPFKRMGERQKHKPLFIVTGKSTTAAAATAAATASSPATATTSTQAVNKDSFFGSSNTGNRSSSSIEGSIKGGVGTAKVISPAKSKTGPGDILFLLLRKKDDLFFSLPQHFCPVSAQD